MKQNQRTLGRAAILRAIAILGICAAAVASYAQWTVVDLTPGSFAYAGGVYGGQQVGSAVVNGVQGAALWSGTAASWIGLGPAGATISVANGVYNGQQAGQATFSGHPHAGLWTGTAASWVDLNPAGAPASSVNGTSGAQQVGSVSSNSIGTHACMWSGTAASLVDLNPPGSVLSYGLGVGGGQQVGAVETVLHTMYASLWTGSAASWVNLNPAGAAGSRAWGTDGTYQAGFATLGGVGHAGMWSGTAASWVDLNPAGASAPPGGFASVALAEFDGQQAGYATIGGVEHASFWIGSSASWVDLQAYLPPNISYSVANGIWQDASGITYVVGRGYDATAGVQHAYMWVLSPVGPPPYALNVQSQNPNSGVVVTDSDNYGGNGSAATPSSIVYNIAGVQVSLTAPLSSPTGTTFLYWSEDGRLMTVGQSTLQVTMNSNHTATAVYGSPYTLTVQSQNPSSGVSVTVSPNDNNGRGNGSTSFTRVYNPGAQVSLSAPTTSSTGATFLYWTQDGTAVTAGQAVVQVAMTANHSMSAVYGYTLTVQSQNPNSGVSVTVTPSDANGNANGVTQFTRVYVSGTVSLTAPAKESGHAFKYWILDSQQKAPGQKTLSIAMGANHTAVAVY